MTDLVVIGGGPSGYEAAAYAAKIGKSVILFEKNELGGTCLNAGCIPAKTFLRSARALEDCRDASKYGVNGAETAALDMAALQARKQNLVVTLKKGISAMLKRLGVQVIQSEAKVLDAHRVEADGIAYESENILLATGAVPASPPIPGLRDNPAVLDSTAVLEMTSLPESIVIIGGGVIGLEFATFFATAGTKVTVVEMMPKIAPMADDEIAKRLLVELKKRGIQFRLSTKVESIDGHVLTVQLPDETQEQLSAECILCAIGRTVAIRGLGLEEAGVEMTRRGIVTDERGRTSVPGIWASGDCTGRLQLAHAATREGIVAVRNMFGDVDTMRYGAIPSVIYTHPEVAQVGATEAELQAKGIAYKKAVVPMAIAGRFMVENEGKAGTVKVLADAETGRLLGVHMIGGCCGEYIASAAAMLETEMCVEDIRQIVFPHPSQSEALREAILQL